jgi:rhodanese-related sulfurtransferase
MLSDTPASGELVALCAALKQVGFAQPRVLDGGLLAWRRAKGPIDGDPLAQRALTRVAPAEFAEARGDPRWLVVDLTSAPAKEVQAWLPGAVRAPATRDQAKLAANLESMAAKRAAKGRARRLLVVDADGAQLERLEAAIAHSLPQDVLFLEGGLAGWKRYWAEQNAIWAGSAGGPRKAKCGA